jgi:DNA-directed RNA polymerase specialized sigma24 family protein
MDGALVAPTHNAVVVAVNSASLDLQLAHRAAALLGILEPRKTTEQLVHELIDEMRVDKLAREARGLNHWDERAPIVLARIIRQARREKLQRYQEAETFFKTKHSEVLRFARAIVKDYAGAEAVASETYRELLEGRTSVANFFAALVANARNYMMRRSYQRDKVVPLDEAFAPSYMDGDSGDDGDVLAFEPASRGREDQDPLDILIAREGEEARRQRVATAMKDPRWRYIKRRDWAMPLLEDVRN